MNVTILPKNNRQSLYLSLAFSLLSLGGAYLAQLLGYQPCSLCIYQRIPYGLIIVLSVLGLFLKNHQIATKLLLVCIIITFVCEIGLASYHVLIEHHILEETSSCNGALNLSDDPSEAINQLISKPAISCAHPEIIVLGLSMAEWNLFFVSFITAIVIYSRITYATARR